MRQHRPVQGVVLGPQRLARPQHRLDHPLQHRLARDQLADPGREPALAHLADLQPEAAQDAADAQLDVQQLALQELAPDQQRPDLLGRRRLAVHRPEPAHPQAAGRCRARPCGRSSPPSPTAPPSPVASRAAPPRTRPAVRPACSHCDSGPASSPIRVTDHAELAEEPTSASGSLGHLGLADDPPGRIDHAHAALFQRHVDPGIMLHGCPSMMPGADPLGPRTHHHSEGQPPRRSLQRRPITASSGDFGLRVERAEPAEPAPAQDDADGGDWPGVRRARQPLARSASISA